MVLQFFPIRLVNVAHVPCIRTCIQGRPRGLGPTVFIIYPFSVFILKTKHSPRKRHWTRMEGWGTLVISIEHSSSPCTLFRNRKYAGKMIAGGSWVSLAYSFREELWITLFGPLSRRCNFRGMMCMACFESLAKDRNLVDATSRYSAIPVVTTWLHLGVVW